MLVSSTPTQETGSPVQIENPAEPGSHIEPIPVEHLPDTPVSQKSKLSHDLDSLSSESSKSKPRRSRSKRSKERELNALRASSPNESKRDLLASWTMSGYYSSPYTGMNSLYWLVTFNWFDPYTENTGSCLLNEHPWNLHFIQEKLGFTEVCIIFLLLAEKQIVGGLWCGSYKHPQSLFGAKIRKKYHQLSL